MDRPIICDTSERGLLGCIVTSAGEAMDELEMSRDLFFRGEHLEIFSAITALHTTGKRIDTSSVISQLGVEAMERLTFGLVSDVCFYPSPRMAATFHKTLGEKLTLRRAQELGRWTLGNASQVDDVNAFCGQIAQRAATLDATADGENVLLPAVNQMNARLDRMERGEKPIMLKTPLEAWNRIFGGLSEGGMYAIAARPGFGKTALMEQMLMSFAANDVPVLVFEKDMSPQVLIERIACREANVPYWKYSRDALAPHEIRNVRLMGNALKDTPLYLYNPVGLTAERMCAITRREVRTHGVKAVFLDHIQVLRRNGKDLREGLTEASITIRQCVNETGVPHVVLAHLNREGAKGRPSAEHIKEFDQLFGDVDGLAILWSEMDAADVGMGCPRKMKIYAAKNRGGPESEENVDFDGSLMRFQDPKLQ